MSKVLIANGMPVITTRGAPWRELEEFRCGWWVDVGVEPLAEALASVMEMSRDELSSMGAAGRKLVMARYSWSVVAQKLLDGYCHILDVSPDRLVP